MSDSDDGSVVPAEDVIVEPAPVEEPTAAPEVTETTPEEGTEPATKTFTQEELDAILAKRLAKAERSWKREQQTKPVEVPEAFDGDGFLKTPEELIADYEAKKQKQDVSAKFAEREDAALEKYEDYLQVTRDNFPVSDAMAEAIMFEDHGPEILYYLGSHRNEAARIARLPSTAQAVEIGKIAVQVAANPPARKTTGAPPPISPVTPQSSGAPVHDTTDPRSVQSMSTSDWIAAERQRQIRKLERQNGA